MQEKNLILDSDLLYPAPCQDIPACRPDTLSN